VVELRQPSLATIVEDTKYRTQSEVLLLSQKNVGKP